MAISVHRIASKTFSFPMKFANANTRWNIRSLLLIKIESDTFTGLGEASPLPGYSYETLLDAKKAMADLPDTFLVPEDVSHAFLLAEELSKGVSCFRFALETAFLDLLSKHRNLTIPRLLGAKASPIKCSTLYRAELSPEDNIAICKKQKVDCIKVKAPNTNETSFVERITQFAQHAPDIAIRIDANQSWSKQTAQFYCDKFSPIAIEFIEEPCKNWQDSFEIQTTIPFACDESLHIGKNDTNGNQLFYKSSKIKFALLKPALIGGIKETLSKSKLLKSHDVTPLVSHCLGGVVEYAMLRQLASISLANTAHGIGIHKGMEGFSKLVENNGKAVLSEDGSGLGVVGSLI